MVKYHKLFEVIFFHEYYDASSSNDFEITPTPTTWTRLRSYGVVYKQTSQGFTLLYKEDNRRLFENLKQEITLDFGIRVKNKHFETFTNVIPSSENRKYLFSNRWDIKEVDQEKVQIYLHSDSFIKENKLCLCTYRGKVLSELLEAEEVFISQGDETIFEGEINNSHTAANFLGDDFGVYDIKTPDSEVKKLLYLPDTFFNYFGLVELAIGGKHLFFEEVVGNKYQINFGSRQAQWNYFFICKPDKMYDSIELFLGKEKLPFKGPENVTLINGQQALKVASQNFLMLKERYKGESIIAELKSSKMSDLVVKKLSLTTPDVTRIKGKRENGAEIYFSDMYIYL